MKTLAIQLSIAALALSFVGCASSLKSEHEGEVDSPSKAFVQYGLDLRAEAYLVCVYDTEMIGGAKNELQIRATIVDRIKGTKQIGESLSFKRVSDSGVRDTAGLKGKLLYVFLDRDADGRAYVDAQDPQALWGYRDEFQELVTRFRKEGLSR